MPTNKSQFSIRWLDAKVEPTGEYNPDYSAGVDLDGCDDTLENCNVELPYPAKKVGGYFIVCKICDLHTACVTEGKDDDPRSMRFNCKNAERL